MAVKVRIPDMLRKLTNGQDVVALEAGTVKEMIETLEKAHPGIKERICDEQGNVRRFVNIFVNEEDIRFQENLETPLSAGTEVSILPAVAGGSGKAAGGAGKGGEFTRRVYLNFNTGSLHEADHLRGHQEVRRDPEHPHRLRDRRHRHHGRGVQRRARRGRKGPGLDPQTGREGRSHRDECGGAVGYTDGREEAEMQPLEIEATITADGQFIPSHPLDLPVGRHWMRIEIIDPMKAPAVDESDEWSEEDLRDLTASSLRNAQEE